MRKGWRLLTKDGRDGAVWVNVDLIRYVTPTTQDATAFRLHFDEVHKITVLERPDQFLDDDE